MELHWVGTEAADEIARIARELFFEVYPYVSEEGLEKFIESCQTPDRIREQLENGTRYAYIIDEDGSRAGYLAFEVLKDRSHFSKLYLFPGYRGKGIGNRCMMEIEDIAHRMGADTMYLEVNCLNTGAISLYRRRGYREIDRVKGKEYTQIIMEKDLRSE